MVLIRFQSDRGDLNAATQHDTASPPSCRRLVSRCSDVQVFPLGPGTVPLESGSVSHQSTVDPERTPPSGQCTWSRRGGRPDLP
ncbi:hypothetical protein N7468_009049 [Penicillium chermesinum]|uniref:Uncharacterized protein n=1 Tax=Penicillium chermesinum TaxID=63820 RepID=A0A9W9TFS1_9EURO|nr:uncharacterized protein N7468_009049 [Penicillium chermesinum]KAJ5219845.1 hypothetical protein N7468_009049 [Penicillium chermesinum]